MMVRPEAALATILLVNDERILRTLIAAGLRRVGYSVLEAAGLRRAVQLASRRQIDLLITELALPGGDGLELASRIRETCPEAAVLFLARSPHPRPLERRARRNGYTVIREPFDAAGLLGEVAARVPPPSSLRKPPSSKTAERPNAARRSR